MDISHCHSLFLQRQDFMKNSQYRHIVYVEKPIITDVPQMNFSASMTCELNTISEMEGSSLTFSLLSSLNTVT